MAYGDSRGCLFFGKPLNVLKNIFMRAWHFGDGCPGAVMRVRVPEPGEQGRGLK
jgi:hypothetical protein